MNLKHIILIILLLFFIGGCKEKPASPGLMTAPPGAGQPGAAQPGSQQPGFVGGSAAGDLQAEKLPAEAKEDLISHKLNEESFIESPARRDPFRSFLLPLTKQKAITTAPQIFSILDQYQLDELNLIAIISGSGPQAGSPIAMVEDPAGVGHVIHRGNYVGKGETVRRISSGEEIQIFWKVARIREDAVVFEREDPLSATDATVTKILALAEK